VIEFHDEDYHAYTFLSDDKPIAKFEVTGTYQEKGSVWGEVSVEYLFDGEVEPVFKYKRLNMLTDKRPGIEDLDARADQWDWDSFYEQVTSNTVTAVRQPPKRRELSERDDDGVTASFLVDPFILRSGVSLLFGPGGTGKSMIALAMALSVTTGRTIFGRKPTRVGPVLYLDYEDSIETHELRMTALMKGMVIKPEERIHPIEHLRPSQAVSRMRRDLLGIIRDLNPALVIVDSVGLARGGDAMGSEETIRLFSTLASLGTAVLGIDHMTKDDVRGGKMVTPYGSIYTVNSVRLAWSIKAADLSDDTNTYVNLIQTKRNNVARHAPTGAHIEFVNEQVGFGEAGDIFQPVLKRVVINNTDMWSDPEAKSTLDRAVEWLTMNGKASAPEIALALGVDVQTLGKAMRRDNGVKVKRVPSSGGVVIWEAVVGAEIEEEDNE